MATTKREHAAVRPPAVIDPDLDPDAFWEGAETYDLAADDELWDRDDLEDLDADEDEWVDLDTQDGDLFDPLEDAGDDEDEPGAVRRRRR